MFLTGWQISWCQGIRGGSFRYWWHSIRCYLRGRSFQRIRSGIWWHCSFQEGKFYELESDQNEIGFFHLWMKVVFKWSMRRSFKCYIFKKMFSSTVWWRTQQLWGSYYCWSCVQICVLQPSANGCWIHPRGIYLDFTLIMNRKGTHFLCYIICIDLEFLSFIYFVNHFRAPRRSLEVKWRTTFCFSSRRLTKTLTPNWVTSKKQPKTLRER